MQHGVRQQVRNSLRHRTGVKLTTKTKFLQKKPILQECYLANLFCMSFILQTYFAGGEMRVQI